MFELICIRTLFRLFRCLKRLWLAEILEHRKFLVTHFLRRNRITKFYFQKFFLVILRTALQVARVQSHNFDFFLIEKWITTTCSKWQHQRHRPQGNVSASGIPAIICDWFIEWCQQSVSIGQPHRNHFKSSYNWIRGTFLLGNFYRFDSAKCKDTFETTSLGVPKDLLVLNSNFSGFSWNKNIFFELLPHRVNCSVNTTGCHNIWWRGNRNHCYIFLVLKINWFWIKCNRVLCLPVSKSVGVLQHFKSPVIFLFQ